MSGLRHYLQHVLNPLHVYCRLCGFGLTLRTSRRLCRLYERWVYRRLPLGRASSSHQF